MCGIYCVARLFRETGVSDVVFCKNGAVQHALLCQAVQRRGPDHCASLHFAAAPGLYVEAMSAVLCMRGGGEVVRQPALVTPDEVGAHSCSSFLQWNGEVFGGSLELSSQASDTTAILDHLHRLERECVMKMKCEVDVTEECRAAALTQAHASFAEMCMRFFQDGVEGPYAFVYYASSLQMFLCGRDPLGRRSLLTHVAVTAAPETLHNNGEGIDNVSQGVVLEVIISSVAAEHDVQGCTAEEPTGKPQKRLRLGVSDHGDDDDNDSGDCNDDAAALSSGRSCWQELPNTGLFVVSVAPSLLKDTLFFHVPWTVAHSTHPLLRFRSQPHLKPLVEEEEGLSSVLRYLLFEGRVGSHPLLQGLTSFEMLATTRYIQALWKAVVVRVQAEHSGGDPTRPVGVLFSGGIDCTVLAAIAHYTLPLTTPIELINVAFGDAPELTPDRLATFKAFEQLLQLRIPATGEKQGVYEKWSQDGREWRLVLVDVPYNADDSQVRSLICPGNAVIDMSIGSALWHAAQGRGRMQSVRANEAVARQIRSKTSSPAHHKLYRVSSENSKQCKDGSFSSADADEDADAKFAPLVDAVIAELEAFGGESSSAPVLLSTLGKDHAAVLRPILARYKYKKLGHYLNDAFDAGVIAFAKRNEAPSKAIRLVRSVDMARVRRVEPAEWFYSGVGEDSPLGLCVSSYTCEARVLLLGMGADETLGGYTRHRRAFERHGIEGLAEELNRDFSRLWKRNLGRDDRVVCDSGREGRYPYLDEKLLTTLAEIAAGAFHRANMATADNSTGITSMSEDVALQQALEPVCCFTTLGGIPGVGDKKILRRCAAILGLGDVVRLQKRAIQFGSRVARAPV